MGASLHLYHFVCFCFCSFYKVVLIAEHLDVVFFFRVWIFVHLAWLSDHTFVDSASDMEASVASLKVALDAGTTNYIAKDASSFEVYMRQGSSNYPACAPSSPIRGIILVCVFLFLEIYVFNPVNTSWMDPPSEFCLNFDNNSRQVIAQEALYVPRLQIIIHQMHTSFTEPITFRNFFRQVSFVARLVNSNIAQVTENNFIHFLFGIESKANVAFYLLEHV